MEHFFETRASQMQSWLVGEKSADEVFTLLKLDKAGDNILSQAVFNTWHTYLKMFNRKFPHKRTTMVAKLKRQYNEEGMLKIVVEALKVKKTSGIATLLRSELLHQWAASGKSIDDVFTLLKLDRVEENLLGSVEFETWSKYVAIYNRLNEREKTTLFTALAARYSDESLSKMIETAQKVPNTMTIGLQLENSLFRRWVKAKKFSKEIFTLLRLKKAGDNLLASPQLTTFIKYSDAIHVAYLKSPIVEVVRKYYDDFRVVSMIMAVDETPSSVKNAKRMEDELLKDWMTSKQTKNTKNTLDQAFKMLRLDKTASPPGSQLFDDPMFNYWLKFLSDHNKEYTGKYVPRTQLIKTFKSEELINMVQTAKKNPATKDRADMLEEEILQQLMYAGKDLRYEVAKILNVKDFTSPNWMLLKKYDKDWNKYVDYQRRKKSTTKAA